jgi:C4-dicarboxylate transporter, DctM subunit
VPIFAPLAVGAGWDPIAFAIIGILAIEAGLLTPPFGLLVYAVKGFLNDDKITLVQLFGATIPYWLMILVVVILVALFPEIASWLPSLMLGR